MTCATRFTVSSSSRQRTTRASALRFDFIVTDDDNSSYFWTMQSCARGWRLLVIVTAYIQPTTQFEPYFRCFLQTTAYTQGREFNGSNNLQDSDILDPLCSSRSSTHLLAKSATNDEAWRTKSTSRWYLLSVHGPYSLLILIMQLRKLLPLSKGNTPRFSGFCCLETDQRASRSTPYRFTLNFIPSSILLMGISAVCTRRREADLR